MIDLADYNFVRLETHASPRVVKFDLNDVRHRVFTHALVVASAALSLRSGLVGALMQHSSLFLLIERFELVTERKYHRCNLNHKNTLEVDQKCVSHEEN